MLMTPRWRGEGKERGWLSLQVPPPLSFSLPFSVCLSLTHTNPQTHWQNELLNATPMSKYAPSPSLDFSHIGLFAISHTLSTFLPQDLCPCFSSVWHALSPDAHVIRSLTSGLYSNIASSENTSLTSLFYLVASIFRSFSAKHLSAPDIACLSICPLSTPLAECKLGFCFFGLCVFFFIYCSLS